MKSPDKPFVLWFTGFSGAGKTTLSQRVYQKILDKGYKVELLDGDILRSIFPGIGYSKEDRDAHVKRVGYLASLLERNGVIVITSLISPYLQAREEVRKNCINFIEVYLSASIESCEKRDTKGLYKKARAGEIGNFTGINDPYEPPINPEINIPTDRLSIEESIDVIEKHIHPYFND